MGTTYETVWKGRATSGKLQRTEKREGPLWVKKYTQLPL